MKDNDNVIEPGELAYINSVNVVNEGLMPSPLFSDFALSIVDNTTAKSLTSFNLPKAIEPG